MTQFSLVPSALMYEFEQEIKKINHISIDISSIEVFDMKEVSNFKPKFNPPELGLIYLISYLYILYYEIANVNIKYLIGKFDAYNVDPDNTCNTHRKLVHDLRTYFNHSILFNKEGDSKILLGCHRWFYSCCQTAVPDKDEEWKICLTILLEKAVCFVKILLECVKSIERDSSFREEIGKEWQFFRNKNYSPYKLDQMIELIANDMGREYIDPSKFRKKYYDRWKRELDFRRDIFDYDIEMRKLIEASIVNEIIPTIPITGDDIMEYFAIGPGSEVGAVYRKAQEIYFKEPCKKDELLQKLKTYMEGDH